jgi:hypothetical protein
MNKLTVNDLPPEVVAEMKRMISEDPQMAPLISKKNTLIRNRQYVKAMEISRLIKSIEDKVVKEYLEKYEGQTEQMGKLMEEMNDEDRENINVYTNSIIFFCDMIETLAMETDSILKKYHPDYRIEMYDKIIELGKEAHGQVKFMSDNTDSVYQVSFADSADNITTLVLNKVKSFIRKLRSKPRRKRA